MFGDATLEGFEMQTVSWPVLIGLLLNKREAIQAADSFRLYGYGLPRVALADYVVDELEETIGRLPADYRGFLDACDGWLHMTMGYHLFERNELLGGGLGEVAAQRLDDWAAALRAESTLVERLTVVGAADLVSDVFCLTKEGGVVWLADGALVERFASFEEFFRAMIAFVERMPAVVAQQTAELLREGHEPPQ